MLDLNSVNGASPVCPRIFRHGVIMRLFAAVAVAYFLLPQQPTANKSGTPSKEQDTQQEKDDKNRSPIIVQCNVQTYNPETQSQKSNQEPKSIWYLAYLVSGTVVGIVSIGTAILVRRQILSYQAKERAWMIMEISQSPPIPNVHIGNVRFRGDIRNFGETPAIILFAQTSAEILLVDARLPVRPEYLSKSPPVPSNDAIAPKTGGMPVYWDITQHALDEITAGRMILYVFGRVLYRDIFRKKRETRYCFRYYPAERGSYDPHIGFFAEGSPEYHWVK
jgi:hypothetical protein